MSSARKNNEEATSSRFSHSILGSPGHIWRSPISWKITLAVFITILTVQVFVFIYTVERREAEQLEYLKDIGRNAVLQTLDEDGSLMAMQPSVPGQAWKMPSPVSDQEWNQLSKSTKIIGMAVYSAERDLLEVYGETTIINLETPNQGLESYWGEDGSFYEFVLRPLEILGQPYLIVLKMEASSIAEYKINYAQQNFLILLLMAGLVTAVLMMVLGYLILEPILFLRNNLIIATKNPDKPQIEPSPFGHKDEIGEAIGIAYDLIKQNASNLYKMKSAAEDQIHKLAYYDNLTELPNRTKFLQRLTEMARVEGSDRVQRAAILAIDLDHFKDVNDSMGHKVGDGLLRAVGKRLRAALPEQAEVARTGEDEYAVMMPLVSDSTTSMDVAQRILKVIRSEPFKVYNENFQIRASVGVATFPDDGTDPNGVLKNADIALNRAKEEGRDTLKEYTEDFDRAVQQRFQMLRDLRDALENQQLELFFQPQFDLREQKIIGAEALIRWFKEDNSREGGSFISPGVFIPIAEQSGLIVPIGEWVMHKACERAAQWREELGQDIRIAVNVSGVQFLQSDVVGHTRKVLQETGLPPHLLELEVTESAFMEDIQQTINILQELHAIGIELAIDDFGTGYSSLSYLRQFPIDRLKIDQSFIRNALNDADDASIAKTIIALGRSLNLKVIAEGVETRDHEEFLLNEGCDEVQGFRYSKPVPNRAFKEFVESFKDDFSQFDIIETVYTAPSEDEKEGETSDAQNDDIEAKEERAENSESSDKDPEETAHDIAQRKEHEEAVKEDRDEAVEETEEEPEDVDAPEAHEETDENEESEEPKESIHEIAARLEKEQAEEDLKQENRERGASEEQIEDASEEADDPQDEAKDTEDEESSENQEDRGEAVPVEKEEKNNKDKKEDTENSEELVIALGSSLAFEDDEATSEANANENEAEDEGEKPKKKKQKENPKISKDTETSLAFADEDSEDLSGTS